MERAAEIIGVSKTTYVRWEMGEQQPHLATLDLICKTFDQAPEELGFFESQPQLTPSSSQTAIPDSSLEIEALLSRRDASMVIDEQTNIANSLYRVRAQAIEPEQGNAMNRQEFLRGATRMVSLTLLAPSQSTFDPEILDRFLRAIEKPSTIDVKLLDYLENRSESYWKDHFEAVLASRDLLSYAKEHFVKITSLLEEPLLSSVRNRLCSAAGSIALLIGTLYFDMKSYTQAENYYRAAIKAAQEAKHIVLQAIGWGWVSLACTYNGDIADALTCVQVGRRLAFEDAAITVRTWLAAIEAEIHANLHNPDASLKALDEAALIDEDHSFSAQMQYYTSFDRLQFRGYRGVCYLKIAGLKGKKTAYLADAQATLTEALTFTEPSLYRLRSTFLADLASVCVRQGEIEKACDNVVQALVMNPLKSKQVEQRALSIRQELDPWSNTSYVKILDEQLRTILTDYSQFVR